MAQATCTAETATPTSPNPEFNSGPATPSGSARKSADHLEVLREMVRAGAGAEPTGNGFTVATMWLRTAHKAQRVSAL